jgi:hypothetical protein
MLHHVGIEIRPAEIERAVTLFELVGFTRVEPPPSLAANFTWVEREGTQIHLMHVDDPVVPPAGHLALVVPDFDPALDRLRASGFDPQPGREHWGVPRANVYLEGGQRVELMAAPPPPAGTS